MRRHSGPDDAFVAHHHPPPVWPQPSYFMAPFLPPQMQMLTLPPMGPIPIHVFPLPYPMPPPPVTMPLPLSGPESYERLLALDETVRRPGIAGALLESCSHLQTLTTEDAQRLTTQRGRCVVCLDDFEEGNVVRRLPCLCVFHRDCIDRHFIDNVCCPVCRTSLRA